MPPSYNYWDFDHSERCRVPCGEHVRGTLHGSFFGPKPSINSNAYAQFRAAVLSGRQAGVLRLYTDDVALAWVFALEDFQTKELFTSWLKEGKVRIKAFFDDGPLELEVPVSDASRAGALCSDVVSHLTPVAAASRVKALFDAVCDLECDGLLSSAVFAPLSYRMESQRKHACFVSTKLVTETLSVRD